MGGGGLGIQSRIQLWLGRNVSAARHLAVVDLSALSLGDATAAAASAMGPATARLAQQLPWDPQSDKVVLAVAGPSDNGSSSGGSGGGNGAQLRLQLDLLLPHAARVAAESPDAQARSAACELLHAVALWMVGSNHSLPEGAQDADYT